MFNTKQKLIASSICHIFETSKPLGNSTTVAVLNDGAGISYGIPQATHRSGNLRDVIERYLAQGNYLPYSVYLVQKLKLLRRSDAQAIQIGANDSELKRVLKEIGNSKEMRKAQLDNVESRMRKAERACAGSNFITTMALAVIYDSLNHGSFERIRDRVEIEEKRYPNSLEFEKAWIREYVWKRDSWLESIPRLASTDYRTDFFKEQINKQNWNLTLPMNVHGFMLKEEHINQSLREIKELKYEQETKTTNNETENEEQQTTSEVIEQTPIEATQSTPVKTLQQEAPAKENSVSTATKVSFLGYTIPTSLIMVWGVIQNIISQGYVTTQQIGETVINTIKDNQKYLFYMIIAIIVLIIVKKIFKQLSFNLAMLIKAIPFLNNVEIIQNKKEEN